MVALRYVALFLISIALHCAKVELKEDIKERDLDELLEIFTERRIELNLRSNTVPKNKELFFAIARELSLHPQRAYWKLKEKHPQIFMALFQKEKEG